ncbi:hypothetical protein MTR67_000925 [Solanum verrucosum]|uniref:F-box domain-containing protein n=1 Tax=Solanum verrucosum TaxID=315347 RepID=A0AAF0TBX2_SOLVR|nr:hypothetical protein MTR67_000925 [Solanum verrucosum]
MEKMKMKFSIPDEIMFEIFSWLPVKLLMRFKCVSRLCFEPEEKKFKVDLMTKHIREGYIKNLLDVGVVLSVFMTTTLIAFMGKMGCLVYALKVFDAIISKQICSWNAMISYVALNGREKHALTMYVKMRARGLQPNEITCVAALSACAHVQLVDLGF